MNSYQKEELENIRRSAERGRKAALLKKDSLNVDLYQHILDIYERIIKA